MPSGYVRTLIDSRIRERRIPTTGIECCLPDGVLVPDLGLQIAGFAAGTTIVYAVFAQADFKEALAQRAVFVAGTGPFRLVTDHAHVFLGHNGRLARFGGSGNGTMVDDPAAQSGAKIPGRMVETGLMRREMPNEGPLRRQSLYGRIRREIDHCVRLAWLREDDICEDA